MSSWKLKKFANDVVYDLRNRGLLPVVALLLVAIVAIPIVISRGGSSSAPIADPAALEEAAANAPEAQAAVIAYQHGLRKYQDRLNKLSSKDPFIQKFAPKVTGTSDSASASAAGGGGAAVGTGSTEISDTTGTGTTDVGSPPKKKKKGKKKKTTTTKYYTWQADVLVGEASAALTPIDGLATLAPLPSATAPVLIYLGTNNFGRSALFLVSSQVTSLSGPGICVPSPDDCGLLALSPGQTEDLAYSVDGKTYRIQLVRLRQVVSSQPPG
jgi:hypothetical protein